MYSDYFVFHVQWVMYSYELYLQVLKHSIVPLSIYTNNHLNLIKSNSYLMWSYDVVVRSGFSKCSHCGYLSCNPMFPEESFPTLEFGHLSQAQLEPF